MERSMAVLPSTSQRVLCKGHQTDKVLRSVVWTSKLSGRSRLLRVFSTRQVGALTHVCSHAQSIPYGEWGSSLVNERPSRKVNAAGESSGQLPASDEDEQPSKGHILRKDGLLQWMKNALAKQAARKEELTNSLTKYGVAGVLSYGLLNTIYYLGAFLFVWIYVAPSPGGLGFIPAAKRFLQIFATVWAGSQVTKVFRAAGALALSPFVDRGLTWYTERFNFKSRREAFGVLVGACFGLAAVVFLVITSLWS